MPTDYKLRCEAVKTVLHLALREEDVKSTRYFIREALDVLDGEFENPGQRKFLTEPVIIPEEEKRRTCPECGLPRGQCDPEGVGHYRG